MRKQAAREPASFAAVAKERDSPPEPCEPVRIAARRCKVRLKRAVLWNCRQRRRHGKKARDNRERLERSRYPKQTCRHPSGRSPDSVSPYRVQEPPCMTRLEKAPYNSPGRKLHER